MHLRKNDLNFPDNSPILEIGGGGNPHPRSDILVDRFLDDDIGFAQRGRSPLVIGDRIMIQADGKSLPFIDKQFNYLILSHVIEHIHSEDIHQFVNELQRVAKGGYIEAPSIVYENMRDIPEHIWYVFCEPDAIHLCKKTKVNNLKTFLDPLFYDKEFCAIVEKHADLFFTGMEWQNSFKIQIHEQEEDLISFFSKDWAMDLIKRNIGHINNRKESIKLLFPPLLFKIIKKTKTKFKKRENKHFKIDWRDLVVCPSCHSQLVINLQASRMQCSVCLKEYNIRADHIPSFL